VPSPQFFFWSLLILVPLAVAEYFWIRRKGRAYPSKEVAASVGVDVGRHLTGLLTKVPFVAAFAWIASFQVTTLTMNKAWHWVALFFGVEFTYYWLHRFSHEIRWFWASHSVHHSSNHYNLPAALRLGWTNVLSGLQLIWVPLILIGFPVQYVFGMLALNLIYQYWLHTEAIGKLWKPLEWAFNTPSHHRVHHARNGEYLDANYGGVLIVFDRLFGTFIEERAEIPCDYGLTTRQLSHNPIKIALGEYVVMLKDVVRAPDWKSRLQYVFGRPGYSHDGSRETTAMVRARLGINVPQRSVSMKSVPRKLMIAASLVAVGLLAVSCHRFRKHDPESRAAFIQDRISGKLDFDETQEAKLKDVTGEVVALVKEFKALRARDHAALIELVNTPELDQERVLSGIAERRALIDARLPQIVAKYAELHKTLTPEQRKEIVEMIEDHHRD
jgi:sterol desaturase/sphingolipid hydroxylase (fatty acid hydroxylase superfamily)/Spy/CpxP family protein refolding chaperone